MNYEEALNIIADEFKEDLSNERYLHTIGVIEMALTLNKIHQLHIKEEQVFYAACFHDLAKFLPREVMLKYLQQYYPNEYLNLLNYPKVWHSFVGPYYVKDKCHINDPLILDAIKYHTTGRPMMTSLEKIIFISDYIEKNTRFEDGMIRTRKIAMQNLNAAVKVELSETIRFLEENHRPIYELTKETYNFYQNFN